MPKPRRLPHVMVEAGVGKNSKLAALPSDTARLGYFYVVLGEAKLQRPAGRFASRGLWREVAGRFARFLPDYLKAGLMHEAPTPCGRCCLRFGETPPGTLLVHDWHLHQIDPGAADRAEDWRKSHQGEEPEPAFDQRSMPVQSPFDQRSMNEKPRARVTREARGEPELERISLSSTPTPSGAVAAQPAGESREKQPRLTREQLDAWATFTDPAWQPFKTAWLAKGFSHPPFGNSEDDADTSQRARLWRIAEDQPQALGRWVAHSPGKSAHEVIAYVFAQRAKLAAEVGLEEAGARGEQAGRKRGDLAPLAEIIAEAAPGVGGDGSPEPEPKAMAPADDLAWLGGAE